MQVHWKTYFETDQADREREKFVIPLRLNYFVCHLVRHYSTEELTSICTKSYFVYSVLVYSALNFEGTTAATLRLLMSERDVSPSQTGLLEDVSNM